MHLPARSIEIEGYRGFKHFEANGFERVNLIVGENNAGKTALLEALEIGLTNGHPARLFLQSIRRQEFYSPTSAIEAAAFEAGTQLYDVRQMFHGRQIADAATLGIGVLGQGASAPRGLALKSNGMHLNAKTVWRVPLIERAAVAHGEVVQAARAAGVEPANVRSIDTTRVSAVSAAKMWTQFVQPNRHEPAVAAALRIIDRSVEDVICQDTEGHLGGSSFLVGLAEPRFRVPVGSLGEGFGRMLGLAICAVAARGGALLVDEIDTGLHHTVHEPFWRWLVESARAETTGFQIFATTHSEDCVRGLAKVAEESALAAQDIAIHRIDAGAATTVRSSGRDLAMAVETGAEVR